MPKTSSVKRKNCKKRRKQLIQKKTVNLSCLKKNQPFIFALGKDEANLQQQISHFP